jgi:non-homologous end joining protein Ku
VALEKGEVENIELRTTNIEIKEFLGSGEFDLIFIEKS